MIDAIQLIVIIYYKAKNCVTYKSYFFFCFFFFFFFIYITKNFYSTLLDENKNSIFSYDNINDNNLYIIMVAI
jgi:hypothetical protein